MQKCCMLDCHNTKQYEMFESYTVHDGQTAKKIIIAFRQLSLHFRKAGFTRKVAGPKIVKDLNTVVIQSLSNHEPSP